MSETPNINEVSAKRWETLQTVFDAFREVHADRNERLGSNYIPLDEVLANEYKAFVENYKFDNGKLRRRLLEDEVAMSLFKTIVYLEKQDSAWWNAKGSRSKQNVVIKTGDIEA
jgi:hypothetical protein